MAAEVYDQIKTHVKYHHNQHIIETKTDTLCFKSDGEKYKRQYAASLDEGSKCINLGIKEDGGTRTVFNGRVFTIEQYLLIDQLAR